METALLLRNKTIKADLPPPPAPSQGELSPEVLPLNGAGVGALPAAGLPPGASNMLIQIMTLSGPPKKAVPIPGMGKKTKCGMEWSSFTKKVTKGDFP